MHTWACMAAASSCLTMRTRHDGFGSTPRQAASPITILSIPHAVPKILYVFRVQKAGRQPAKMGGRLAQPGENGEGSRGLPGERIPD